VLDPVAAHRMTEEATFLFAQSDPLSAAKTIARAMKRQPRGAKVSFFRTLAESLAEHEPGFLIAVDAEINRLLEALNGC